jgi:hypothetical protein
MAAMAKTGTLHGARRLARLALLLLAAVAAPAGAAINPTFNYQGFLLNKNNNLPVETPQDLKFAFYNTATGGSPLFAPENRCNVPVTKGRYDVEIGSTIPGGIPASLFTSYTGLWLEVQVDPDGDCAGSYEAMSPRMRLQSSPYAFNSLYASTASAATTLFSADTIGALPVTSNGAITISTNLFVQGGISVGSISPGQKLAVSGIVESKGVWPDCADAMNPTCGFKFADGSIQFKAAAVTMWEASGDNVYSINPGNLAIGESNPNPKARLHVSTAAGDTGDIFLVTAGTVEKFKVNGLGEVYGGSFHGEGGTLNGVVRSTGDYMTGQLTLMNSSLTVTSAAGMAAPKIKLNSAVEISSAAAAFRGGLYISSNVWLPAGAVYYGDGGGLTNLITNDVTKVWRTGDSMTGQLTIGFSTTTLLGSTLTVTGNAFSVGGSTFSVLRGNTQLGGSSYLARLTVTGGIVATSSVTAQQGLYAPNSEVKALSADFTGLTAGIIANVTDSASLDTDGDNYSITSSSGIRVTAPNGKVRAAYFQGSGEMLTGVLKSTDTTKVRRSGDVMNGNLTVFGSSVTVISTNTADYYSLTVANDPAPADPTYYGLVVTRVDQNVGVQMNTPTAPLEVRRLARITGDETTTTSLDIYSNIQPGYISWHDLGLATSGGEPQGALGFFGRSFIYRANSVDLTSNGGEVFRITSNDSMGGVNPLPYWRFGIGTDTPQDRFHVAVNVQVSSVGASVPTLFVSTSTGRVGISTAAASLTHNLTVGRGIVAGSSITAQGGFFGDGIGITRISTAAIPNTIWVGSITALSGGLHDGVVFSTAVIVNSRLSVGGEFDTTSDLHVKGVIRLDAKDETSPMVLSLDHNGQGDAYINWIDASGALGVLGMKAGVNDLLYKGGTSIIGGGSGVQAFRIKPTGRFIVGAADQNFVPTEMFQVYGGNMLVSNSNASASSLFASPFAVGISTGAPKERLHVASSMLVGADRANAAVFISTQAGAAFTGIGTGYPKALLEVNGNLLGSGTFGVGSVPVTGVGRRFMWVPSNAALRAGGVSTTQWDTVGNYSVGFGYDSIVTSEYSSVLAGQVNTIETGPNSVIAGGIYNYISGESSVIPGGRLNVVKSNYSFAGGYNNYLDSAAHGTFVWGYDDVGLHNSGVNKDSAYRYNTPYVFLIDPDNVKQYKVGVRTPAPQAALDVNGDAQFGSGVTKSSFTAAGFFVPRAMTSAELALVDPAAGSMVYNTTINNICFYDGSAWVTVGNKAACE